MEKDINIKKFQYLNYIDFNNIIGPLLIEWSKTKEDFRVGGSERHRFFNPEYTWHSVDNLFEYEQFFPLRDFILEKISSSIRFETMWAIIAKKHSKGKRHSHKGTRSYCYYVSNGHNGYIVDVGDWETFEECLAKLVADKKNRLEFGQRAGQIAVEKLDIANSVSLHLMAYLKFVN